MFEEKLAARFGQLQAELGRLLYRRYTLQRELAKLEEDLSRVESGLAELDGLKREVETQSAVEEAKAKADAESVKFLKKKKRKKKAGN